MTRLLVIGWDAADWKIINPLLERGEMPHLARLLSDGVHGNLSSIYPSLSPLLWTTIATGKRPHKHGILGFIEPTPDGMDIRPVSNLGRKTKAVWNILTQMGKRSIVVGWWPSHPAEPIRGAMVSNHFRLGCEDDPEKPLVPGTVWPRTWARRLAGLRLHPAEIDTDLLRMFVPDFYRIDQQQDKSLHDLAIFIADTMSVHAAATDLIEHEPWDFAAIYYDGIDHFCHRFMRYHAHKPGRGEVSTDPLREVVANAYRYHDAMLGRLLHLAGDDCAVMIISDHGFYSDHLLPEHLPAEMDGPALEHRELGIFCLRAPGVKRGAVIYGASVLDVTPTILQVFGLPAGQDMDGSPLMNAFINPSSPEPVKSWDDLTGEDGRHPPDRHYDGAASAESLRQLVALGYVAPPSEMVRDDIDRCLKEWKYNLACAQLDAGREDLAAAALRDLIAHDDEDGRFYQMLANCLLLMGDLNGCEALMDQFDASCARSAREADRELARRRADLSDESLIQSGANSAWVELRHRQHLAEKAQGFCGERMLLRCRLAAARAGSAQPGKELRSSLEECAELFGQNREPALFLAQCFALIGDDERALEEARRLLRADPEDWRALALEARIHYVAGRYLEAVNCCIEAIALNRFQPWLHHLLGLSLHRLGENDKAKRALGVALSQVSERTYTPDGSLTTLSGSAPGDNDSTVQPINRATPPGSSESLGSLSAHRMFERIDVNPPADRARVVTVVTGLPRSGTSMMMQMLVAAGFDPYTDGKREADEDNPRGYFEHHNATRLYEDASWVGSARGKVVKIVAQLIPHLPLDEEYRIIFMHRDLEEVVTSQHSMLTRQGQAGAKLSEDQLARTYSQQLVRVQTWLRRQPQIPVLSVDYGDALTDARATALRLARFLGEPFDQDQAAKAIVASLRRQRQLRERV